MVLKDSSFTPDDLEEVFDLIESLEGWVELKQESSHLHTIFMVLIAEGSYLIYKYALKEEWAKQTIKDAIDLGIIRLKKERGEQ